jgi:pantoate--beta-alanine ligase
VVGVQEEDHGVKLARTVAEVRELVADERRAGRVIGLVPTMGYLHEGHLSLVDRCRSLADRVVMSIYVNPLQFGPGEDFEEYPRNLSRDLELAEGRGVDLVFTPDDRELYPSRPAVVVAPKRLADRLCGSGRPGHFEGVLTVVAKLFGIVQPDIAVFGHKDFQQSVLIRRMVADLNMSVRIDVAPTVREPDGLAMSSRNEYLTPELRARALTISQGLAGAVAAFRAGERSADVLRELARAAMTGEGGVDRIEYVECVSAEELEPVTDVAEQDAVLMIAAHVGSTRLIDNVRLAAPDPGLEEHLHDMGGS